MAPSPSRLPASAVALSSLLWFASCGLDTAQSVSSLLMSSPPPARTLLVHIAYGTEEDLARLSVELDLLEKADRVAGTVDALVSEETAARLEKEGFGVEVDKVQTALLDQSSAMSTLSIPGFACYRTVEESASSMTQLAFQYPNLVSVVDIGDSYDKVTPGGSPGYDLQVLVATNRSIPGPKPRFFLMGAIHAREYTTAEVVMRFAESMVTAYGKDADATWLLDNFELHVLPYTNPDGRKVAEQGYLQRKNLRPPPTGSCSFPPSEGSQIGVDLNRNSSWGWGGAGTSTSPCDIVYRGATAASEPETQALQGYIASIFPDQRGPGATDPAPPTTTGVMITIHSYADLVLYPWGYGTAAAPNLADLATLGRKFGYFNHYEVCQAPVCLYSASGTTDDWAYGELGVAAYTIEIGNDFFEPCSSFNLTVLPDNLKALLAAFKHARRPYQTPKGPDALRLTLSRGSAPAGALVALNAVIDDTLYNSNGWGTEPTQNILGARYSVDKPSWANGAVTFSMSPTDGAFNSKTESAFGVLNTAGWAPGRHTLFVEGLDADGNWGAPSAVFFDIQ